MPGFDLNNHTGFCPPEQSAPNNLFISAKGQEWNNSTSWGHQFKDPCEWYGIVCTESSNKIITLDLNNNGLCGLLSSSIGIITSLRTLDLSGNDIKGQIPQELFHLSNLAWLRLNYNQFSGSVPFQLVHLTKLELPQLHSYWLTGKIHLPFLFKNYAFSYTSDCGVPPDFDKPIICKNCTMCCNLHGECHSTKLPTVLHKDTPGFSNYKELSLILLLFVFGFSLFCVTATNFVNKYWKSTLMTRAVSGELIEEEKHYALNTVGHETVYSFFLTKYWAVWMVALTVIVLR